MVHSDSYGRVVLLADIDERHQSGINLLQFRLIFLIGVLQMTERSCRVDIIARIDANLLAILRSNIGHAGVEVHVGHEWCHDALFL